MLPKILVIKSQQESKLHTKENKLHLGLLQHPNKTSVENDFSMIQREKDDSRSTLTSLYLAGIMHANQFETLKKIIIKP